MFGLRDRIIYLFFLVGWIRSKIMLFFTPSSSRHLRGIDHPLCFVFHINHIFSIGLALCHGLHAATHATQAPSPCLSARDGTRSPTGVQRSFAWPRASGLAHTGDNRSSRGLSAQPNGANIVVNVGTSFSKFD